MKKFLIALLAIGIMHTGNIFAQEVTTVESEQADKISEEEARRLQEEEERERIRAERRNRFYTGLNSDYQKHKYLHCYIFTQDDLDNDDII